jgi:threonyl-tRNA synthetase
MQLDFSMPERLDAQYVGDDNARHVPVMLHRAVLGSFERFIGILIEHHAGAMPLWLAPVQIAVLSITEHQSTYAEDVVRALKQAGIRAVADLRNEKISYKIREHSLQKLPYQVIVGDKEVVAQKVAVRTRKGEDLGQMSLADFISRLREEEARLGRAARD